MQDKRPRNEKGQRHGRWEIYSQDNKNYLKRNFINGDVSGLEEDKSSPQLIFRYYAK